MNKECLLQRGSSDCNRCPVAVDFAFIRVIHSAEPNDKLRARFAKVNCPEGFVPVIMGNPDDLLRGEIKIQHGEPGTDRKTFAAEAAGL